MSKHYTDQLVLHRSACVCQWWNRLHKSLSVLMTIFIFFMNSNLTKPTRILEDLPLLFHFLYVCYIAPKESRRNANRKCGICSFQKHIFSMDSSCSAHTGYHVVRTRSFWTGMKLCNCNIWKWSFCNIHCLWGSACSSSVFSSPVQLWRTDGYGLRYYRNQ